MKTKNVSIASLFVILALSVTACSSKYLSVAKAASHIPEKAVQATALPEAASTSSETSKPAVSAGLSTSLTGYETALEDIYTKVNPSVVNIQVTETTTSSGNGSSSSNIPGFEFFFGSPDNQNQQQAPQVSQALGSGFVWDKQGHIVTNNHVVDGADKIQVKFNDGTIVSAKVVGTDVNSDLAVIQLENYTGELSPVTVADSTGIKVGQAAIAIGNPFGLENTMTVGIVSAVGRSLPTSEIGEGASFTIPDIIQTDAPINPGNSGGVLVNDEGNLIGVTAAIESSSGSNAGIGFAIPSSIVQKVVPALISNGKYEHSFLGLTGTTLTPDLAKAMSADTTLRGVLVVAVTAGGPADKAGINGSAKVVTLDGQETKVGGDIITKINGQVLTSMDDLISYLSDSTEVGQKVTLTVIRDGVEKTLEAALAARPVNTTTNNTNNQTPQPASSSVWLGVAVQPVTTNIATEMGLSPDQKGVLIEEVESGSPADQAGLKGSYKPVIINSKRVTIGGDIIISIDGQAVDSLDQLRASIADKQPGDVVSLTILRDGKEQQVKVTLAEKPTN